MVSEAVLLSTSACGNSRLVHLIPSTELPDPDGRHVVAAAIHSGASLIVTFNLQDFPAETLKPYNLAAQHPDDFIVDLLDLH